MKQKELKLAMLKELLSTIKYYGEDPSRRAVKNGICQLLTEDGKRCAIGRHLTKRQAERAERLECTTLGMLYEADIIKEINFKGLPKTFWYDLQDLHDFTANWSSKSLTRVGLDDVRNIVNKIMSGWYAPGKKRIVNNF